MAWLADARGDGLIDTIQTLAIVVAIIYIGQSFRQLRLGRALLVDVIVQQTKVLASMAQRMEAMEARQGYNVGGDEAVQFKRLVDALRTALAINTNDNRPGEK